MTRKCLGYDGATGMCVVWVMMGRVMVPRAAYFLATLPPVATDVAHRREDMQIPRATSDEATALIAV